MSTEPLPESLERIARAVAARYPANPRRAAMFRSCFANTLQTTVRPMADGSVFVITGDIPAMWLRDSSAQVRPYLAAAGDDPQIAALIAGVVRRQMQYILIDPYANAFNAEPSGASWDPHDETDQKSPWLWERKYEIDSLCYPIQLAHLLWRATGSAAHLDATFQAAARAVIATWRLEQRHHERSPYRFVRRNCPPSDTLSHEGRGAPLAYTGMTWSGFRPSDDACRYGYLVPANMFAAVALGRLAALADAIGDAPLAGDARALEAELRSGIAAHAIVEHPQHGPIYAYEVDGLGGHSLMDDANVPSLLALPYLGWCSADDPIYRATRRFVLSEGNPYFYRGRAAAGVGSPHTPPRYVWHIALAIQGLTAEGAEERAQMLDLLEATDAGTGLMHEGFDCDDPQRFTRPWFAWANSMYAELVLRDCGITIG